MPEDAVEQSAKAELLDLLSRITREKGKPLDSWEVTALLETNGLRDVDARTEWAMPDLFALAERLTGSIDSLSYQKKEPKLVKYQMVQRVVKNYLKGMLFAVPMTLQILSMVIIGVGIWSSIVFTVRDATAIAFATLMALATTGGVAQIIGRKGLFYVKLGETILAAKITKRLYAVGLTLVLALSLGFVVFNLYFELFPFHMFKLFIFYYVLLSLLFTCLAIFYMLERYGTIALLILVGITLVWVMYIVLKKDIFTSQYLSLVVTVLCGNLLAYYRIRKLERETAAEGTLLPRPASLFYTLYPYFFYGSCYFLFLIMDRVLAWTTGREYLPYFFWFNYPYEVGLDWALIPLIFTIALVEVFIYELGVLAFNKINKTMAFEAKRFNRHFLFLYLVASLTFLAVGGISIFMTYRFPFYLMEHESLFRYLDVFFNDINIMVFFFASTGYVLLSWALLNCIIFFAYSRHEFAIKSILIGTLVNFVTGYFFSRAFDYYYAVVGLTLGSLVFAVVSTLYAIKFFRRYDYYYYSAY